MLGILLDARECRELHFILRKELDEMLLDLKDHRMDAHVKEAIRSRYRIIFRMYARLASPKELSKYVLGRNMR